MLTRLSINAIAAALIVPLWTVAASCTSGAGAHSGIVIAPESVMAAVVMFGLWSLGDVVVLLKEKR